MADKKISELTVATTPTGTELVEIVQGGVNKQTTIQAIADLAPEAGIQSVVAGTNVTVDATDPLNPIVSASGGGGGGTWGSITGDLDDQTDLYTYLRANRTVTGASAAVQSDDNSIIYLNSATPFNFTLDQLTAGSKISFVNIGAGAVTLIAGSGVTITGSVVISGAVGTNYPSAFVFYHTATTPRVSMGGTNGLASASADTSGATITLNFNSERERIFVGSASFGTAKAVTLSNETNGLVMILFLNLTNVAAVLSFDTDFTMMASDGRWNDSAHTFTPQTTGLHKFSAVFNGTDWVMEASNPYYG